MGRKRKDLEAGKVFNRLTVVDSAGKDKWGIYYWNCMCSCGNKHIASTSALTSGNTQSCGCLNKEIVAVCNKTHGMSYSIEYRHYASMLDRCFNENNKHYKDYGARGITVCTEFVDDFLAFYKDIGPKPKSDVRFSVGRIDNSLGYSVGNIRWETDFQQAQNRSKPSNNTTGDVGVRYKPWTSTKNTELWQARWNDLEGKQHSKCFSTNKFGFEQAHQMAIDYRKKMLEELNSQGAEYAASHGSDKQ